LAIFLRVALLDALAGRTDFTSEQSVAAQVDAENYDTFNDTFGAAKKNE
jgi:hypothetical protein